MSSSFSIIQSQDSLSFPYDAEGPSDEPRASGLATPPGSGHDEEGGEGASLMQATREAYSRKLSAQLQQWNLRLDALRAAADHAGVEAKVELLRQVEALRRVQLAATRQLAEAEDTAYESWQKVTGGLERKRNQLAGAVEALWVKASSHPARKR